jgi:ketosteroid isomerase-like protein
MEARTNRGETMTAAAPASTAAIAQELVALCRAGRNEDAIEKLYSPRIVSVESVGSETMPAEMTGLDAIRGKNEWWSANNEVHSAEVNGPFVGDNQFAVQYTFDVTFKPTGKRTKMTEMALYTVKDGKIVREHFFYNMPNA